MTKLAGFLGSMSLLEDDIPADSAVLNDWNKAVEKALKDDDVSKLHFRILNKD